MGNKKDREKQAEREFNSFLERLQAIRGLEIEVLDKKEIKKKCGKGIYNKVRKGLSLLDHGAFRITFREQESESVWPSDARLGRIVINAAHPVEPSKLVELILKTEGEIQNIDALKEGLGFWF